MLSSGNRDAREESLKKWRLRIDKKFGRQTWHYMESEEMENAWPQTVIDKYWLGTLKVLNRNIKVEKFRIFQIG